MQQRPVPFAKRDDKSGRSVCAPSFGSVMVTGAQTTVQHDPTDERHSPWRTATCTEPAEFAAMQETVGRTGRRGVVPAHTAPVRGRPTKASAGRQARGRGGGGADARHRRQDCHKRDHIIGISTKTSHASAVKHSATMSLRPSDQKPLRCSRTRTCLRERVRKKTTCVPSQ